MESEALARFLLDQLESILQRWREEVRRDPAQPANRLGLSGRALDDHLPALLRTLAHGLLGGTPEQVEHDGAEHGHQRRQHGYAVTELLWELTLFRRVLMAAVEGPFRASTERLDDHSLAPARLYLLDLLDRSVHASISRYMLEAEDERDEARTQVADTTARLQDVNAQLREAHIQKDRFLSVLSHELRNPLAPILSAVQVLQRRGSTDPSIEPQHAIIERQARHLGRLVDDLLDLNRITYGKLELRPEVTSLQTTVSQAVETASTGFEAKGVTLSLDLAEEPVAVFSDGMRLSQVVTNLLANALKFTPKGGLVTVSLRGGDGEAVLTVRDTGAGISADMLPRIFEPFEQEDTSLAHSQGGLGLGLMVARGLVEAHGGRIEAASLGTDQGATFVVRLPLSLTEPGAPIDAPNHSQTISAPRRIVLIEDNEDAREALATALRLFGHEVFVGSRADEALKFAESADPDTFILDIGLPGVDGYALARTLRERREMQGALLIAVTGYGQDADKQKARDAGFDHHLTKPVDVDKLEALLRR
jgi:signal transduction histidine kinase/CheY-like chemotaxis protein